MATPIQMPALSPTMKEGKITRWLKKEGDKVSSGEAIAECETDKSNLEIEAFEDGFIIQISIKEGDSAPVGAPIGFIGEKGEKPPAASPSPVKEIKPSIPVPPAAAPAAPSAAASKPPAQGVPIRKEEPAAVDGRLLASPLARKVAEEKGLDLHSLQGSGPQGRIVKRDVEAAGSQGSDARSLAPIFQSGPIERSEPEVVAMSSMRRVIAERMAEVKPGVPHFYLTVEIEMDAALQIREEAKALESKISVNDIIVKAAGIALRRLPKMNVSLQGDKIFKFHNADVGIAVAIEDGLITPIIRDADQKGLSQLSFESRDLAEKARRKALKPEQYTGGSITVSNLGMFGVSEFIAVINPPQAAILAVGAVAEKAVARKGQVVVRQMMSMTLSGDHRVIDGALGAQYLKEVKGLLEHPLRLLF